MKNCHLRSSSRGPWNSRKNILGTFSLLLAATLLPYTTAVPTPEKIINNALQVYEQIENYAAVVHTYAATATKGV